MWHDLVLHGIGGRTVAEAKLRMSYDEYLSWCEFMRRRGTLHEGMRMEYLVGRLTWIVSQALGGKGEFSEFVRYHDEEVTNVDDLAKLMGVKKVVKRG